jgi:O-antigen/teichoic acid export membrane protein
MRGLDLVIANKFLGAYDMGLLSVARTFPNSYSAVVATIVPIFTPVFIKYWAKGENDALVSSICNSIKTMGLIMIVPISGFIVFSNTFYTLWQKSYSAEEVGVISLLSTITLLQCYFNSTTASMAQISVVVNKLRIPVLVSLFCGILNIILVTCLLKYTNLGMYAIVATSSVILILRYVIFNSIYCSKIINHKAMPFYRTCLKVWLTIPIQLILLYLLKMIFDIRSWGTLIIAAIICGVIGYIIEWIIIEGKNGFIDIIERIRCIKNNQ